MALIYKCLFYSGERRDRARQEYLSRFDPACVEPLLTPLIGKSIILQQVDKLTGLNLVLDGVLVGCVEACCHAPMRLSLSLQCLSGVRTTLRGSDLDVVGKAQVVELAVHGRRYCVPCQLQPNLPTGS